MDHVQSGGQLTDILIDLEALKPDLIELLISTPLHRPILPVIGSRVVGVRVFLDRLLPICSPVIIVIR